MMSDCNHYCKECKYYDSKTEAKGTCTRINTPVNWDDVACDLFQLIKRPYIVEMDLHLRCEVNALDEENAVNVAISELEDNYFTCFMKEDFRNIKVTKDPKDND